MDKKNMKTIASEHRPFANLKSYSVEEILAAGGTTAFSEKMGKSWDDLSDILKNAPKDAFLTDEEFEDALKTLNASK